jgi:hypothetical protein
MSDIFGQSLDLSTLSKDSTQTCSWKRNLQKTMQETDTEKLLPLVHSTELALYYRWQELGTCGQTEEHKAMIEAVNDLWSIKLHKLGWPGQLLENAR